MWWKIKKVLDEDKLIIYAYSRETRNLDGRIAFEKETEEMTCLVLAANDSEKSVNHFFHLLYGVIVREGAPDEKFIAIG